MPDTLPFHMREAGLLSNDAELLVAAFDSTLPYLQSIGGGEMWGQVPFSEKDGFVAETQESITKSQSYRQTGVGDKVRVFIAEVEIGMDDEEPTTGSGAGAGAGVVLHTRVGADGRVWLAVAAACVREDWVPDYIRSQPHLKLQTVDEEGTTGGGFAYLEVMVADHRTGRHHRGAGAALLQLLKQHYQNKGSRTMYVDAWAGNGRNLVK
ncbi:hypothetical protein PG985_007211 [Apiospora marii]|uniref:N-acetyltransferase domain-containing protein n=1 Tax=Apiospora marii TaxID=335849 RepID=A0ABR1SEQ8_9PEZI